MATSDADRIYHPVDGRDFARVLRLAHCRVGRRAPAVVATVAAVIANHGPLRPVEGSFAEQLHRLAHGSGNKPLAGLINRADAGSVRRRQGFSWLPRQPRLPTGVRGACGAGGHIGCDRAVGREVLASDQRNGVRHRPASPPKPGLGGVVMGFPPRLTGKPTETVATPATDRVDAALFAAFHLSQRLCDTWRQLHRW